MSESVRFGLIDPLEGRVYAEQAVRLWHTDVRGLHPDDWPYTFLECFEEVPPILAIGAFDSENVLLAAAGVTDNIGERAQLEFIAVQPDQQGKGYGRVLLEYVEGFVREKGATSVVVENASAMAEEIRFFERYGYEPRLIESRGQFEVLTKDLP